MVSFAFFQSLLIFCHFLQLVQPFINRAPIVLNHKVPVADSEKGEESEILLNFNSKDLSRPHSLS